MDPFKAHLSRAREQLDNYNRDIETYKILDTLWQCLFALYMEQSTPPGAIGMMTADDMMEMARRAAGKNGHKKKDKEHEHDHDEPKEHDGHRGQYL